jgi:hypothetical protein
MPFAMPVDDRGASNEAVREWVAAARNAPALGSAEIAGKAGPIDRMRRM